MYTLFQVAMTRVRYANADDVNDRELMYPYRVDNKDVSFMDVEQQQDVQEKDDQILMAAHDLIRESAILQNTTTLDKLLNKKHEHDISLGLIRHGLEMLTSVKILDIYRKRPRNHDNGVIVDEDCASFVHCENKLRALRDEPAAETNEDDDDELVSNVDRDVTRMNEELPDLPQDENLSEDQRFVLNLITKAIEDNRPFQLLIEGGPGTGKTFLLLEIAKVAKRLRGDSMPFVFMALTGSAASNLPNGTTCHNAMGLDISKQTLIQKDRLQVMDQGNKADRLQLLKHRCGVNGVWVVDEISMISAVGLQHMSDRCANVRDSHTDPSGELTSKPFAGFNFIGVGDHFQIPPGKINKLARYLLVAWLTSCY